MYETFQIIAEVAFFAAAGMAIYQVIKKKKEISKHGIKNENRRQ